MAAECVTPEAINFMATPRPRADLPDADAGALRRARAAADDDRAQRDAVRDRVHRLDRGPRGRLHRHLGGRPRPHHPGRRRPGDRAARPGPARATCSRCGRVPAACSSAPARPRRRSTWRGMAGLLPGRRDLRGDERGRHHGAGARPGRLLRGARAEDDHGGRPDRPPPPHARSWSSGSPAAAACRPATASSWRTATAR